jgi:hypothetical protein
LNKYLSQVEQENEKYQNLACEYYKEALLLCTKSLNLFTAVYLNTLLSYAKFLLNFMKDEGETINVLNIVLQHKDTKNVAEGKLPVDQETQSYFNEIIKLVKSLKD